MFFEEIQKWFEEWTRLKINLHVEEKGLYFHEREIWWASLGANIGFEENGKNKSFERPILVLKKFNQNILWAVPLTSKIKYGKYYFPLKSGSIILSQLRLLSSKRLIRKMGILNSSRFNQIRARIRSII